MSRLSNNYIYNVLYQVFLIVVPLFTAPYLTRVLSSSALGTYDYINSYISIITTLGLIGLQSYGSRQIAYTRNSKENMQNEFSSIYTLRILLLFIVTIAYFPVISSSEYRTYYIIQYGLIVAQFVDISWVFTGNEDMGIVAFRNFIAKFLTVIGIFLFIKTDKDLWKYFALFSLLTLLSTLSIFPLLRRYLTTFQFDIRQSLRHVVPSIKLFIPSVATVLYLQFDKIMLKELSSSISNVSYYGYAEKIIKIPLAIITALSFVMMPRIAYLFSNEKTEELEAYIYKSVQFSLFMSFPMMFGMMAISEDFVPWYLGSEYIGTAYCMALLSPICVLNAVSSVFGSQYLAAINQTKILTLAYYSATFLNLICNALLIPRYAYLGAAVATVIASSTTAVIEYLFINKQLHFTGMGKCALNYLLSSVVMGIVIFVVGRFMSASILTTLLQIVVGVLIYLGIMKATNDEMMNRAIRKGVELVCKIKQ